MMCDGDFSVPWSRSLSVRWCFHFTIFRFKFSGCIRRRSVDRITWTALLYGKKTNKKNFENRKRTGACVDAGAQCSTLSVTPTPRQLNFPSPSEFCPALRRIHEGWINTRALHTCQRTFLWKFQSDAAVWLVYRANKYASEYQSCCLKSLFPFIRGRILKTSLRLKRL